MRKTTITILNENKEEKWIAMHDKTFDLSKMTIKINGKNIVKKIETKENK